MLCVDLCSHVTFYIFLMTMMRLYMQISLVLNSSQFISFVCYCFIVINDSVFIVRAMLPVGLYKPCSHDRFSDEVYNFLIL